ncbi:MAG: hypothetical protein IID39_04810, partial [Planctomycetes bacterium]|nr:hypothetical protein [Planctomycetota bacterium]
TWTVGVHGLCIAESPQVFSLGVGDGDTAGMAVIFPDGGPPVALPPGEPTVIPIEILMIGQSYVPESAMIHYRYDGGEFLSAPMVSVGGDLFEATLPGPLSCDEAPEFYFSTEGSITGVMTDPLDAPAGVYTAVVAQPRFFARDDFEQDQGWTVQNFDLPDGAWERGVPVGGGDRGDPATDFDGSGSCYVTDNEDGNSDVDGGPTRLISPRIDLSDADDPVLTYARWFTVDDLDEDRLDVEISNDDGSSWVLIERAEDWPQWVKRTVRVLDYIELTAQVRVRFSATDNPNDSITEAGVDAFAISELECVAVRRPTDLEVFRGRVVSGEIGDLFDSDDSRMGFWPGITQDSSEAPVWLRLTGSSLTDVPAELRFTLEANVNTPGVAQRIELFNYVMQSYEEIDFRVGTDTDSIVEIVVDGDPSRFVDSKTLEMKAQLTWLPGPLVFFPWTVSVDQAVWKVVP